TEQQPGASVARVARQAGPQRGERASRRAVRKGGPAAGGGPTGGRRRRRHQYRAPEGGCHASWRDPFGFWLGFWRGGRSGPGGGGLPAARSGGGGPRRLGAHRVPAAAPPAVPRYRGMLPCFLGGFLSRFVSSVASASIRRGRVSRGSMMSSRYPRAAAR